MSPELGVARRFGGCHAGIDSYSACEEWRSPLGGWCGPHNINHNQYHPDVEQQGDLFYIAHFNAGLRIYDVSNERLPVEVGYFLPPEPRHRFGPMPEGSLVLQTEDVVVDRRGRGYIYVSDKNQGIWSLRYKP
jgi:hypothetical protein